jgi:hypothetical protein
MLSPVESTMFASGLWTSLNYAIIQRREGASQLVFAGIQEVMGRISAVYAVT